MTTQSKHTPGPWRAVRDPGYPTYYPTLGWNIHAGDEIIFRGTDNEHCQANAELVALLPDALRELEARCAINDRLRAQNAELRKALEACVFAIDLCSSRGRELTGYRSWVQLADDCRAALARSKGEI